MVLKIKENIPQGLSKANLRSKKKSVSILLTSTSKIKYLTLHTLLPEAIITTIKVNEELPSQPFNEGGKYCALKRLEQAKNQNNYDFIISIENYIVEEKDNNNLSNDSENDTKIYKDYCIVYIYNIHNDYLYSGKSTGILVDNFVMEEVMKSQPFIKNNKIIGYELTAGNVYAELDNEIQHDNWVKNVRGYDRKIQICTAIFNALINQNHNKNKNKNIQNVNINIFNENNESIKNKECIDNIDNISNLSVDFSDYIVALSKLINI